MALLDETEEELPPPFYDSLEEYEMKAEERDQLLARLDERSLNMWRVLEKLEKHSSEQNGYILENFAKTNTNTTWRRVHTWVIGIMFSVFIAIITRLIEWW